MNIRDLSALERAATWLDELILACRNFGPLSCKHPKLTATVIRKARSLRASLHELRTLLDQSKGD